MVDLPLACRCGQLRGVAHGLSVRNAQRAICYCDDCQAFARWLGAPDVLDASGATEVLQTSPAHIRLETGVDALRCMRLSRKGLLRWYADCCRTPVANTVAAKLPFAGLIRPFVRLDEAADATIGPVLARVHTQFAIGPVPGGPQPKLPLRMIAHTARRLAGWWWRGEGTPSPFFDARTRAPTREPSVLDADARAALGLPPRP
jgi:hypothetical protein